MLCGPQTMAVNTADEAAMAEALMRKNTPPPQSVTRTATASGGFVVTALYPPCPATAQANPALAMLPPLSPGIAPKFDSGGRPLVQADIDQACTALNVPPKRLWALFTQESLILAGFLSNRYPVILFEPKTFSSLTNSIYDGHPAISDATFNSDHGLRSAQYGKLQEAMQFDADKALQATSWGIGQVMGENFALLGYADVFSMVNDMITSESAQVAATVKFIQAHKGMAANLAAADLTQFATGYNGPGNPAGYAASMAAKEASLTLPNLDFRRAQLILQYLGYAPGLADGVPGKNSTPAVMAFQAKNGLPATGMADPPTLACLDRAIGWA